MKSNLLLIIIVIYAGFLGYFLSFLCFLTIIFPNAVSKDRFELIYQWIFRGSIGLVILGIMVYLTYGLALGKYNGEGLLSVIIVFISVFWITFGYSIYSFKKKLDCK